jgi:hypothetical protein
VPGPTPAMMARAVLVGAILGVEVVKCREKGERRVLDRRVRRRGSISALYGGRMVGWGLRTYNGSTHDVASVIRRGVTGAPDGALRGLTKESRS